MKFVVTITNGLDDKDLVFNVYDTDIARRWANEVSNNYPLYETDRFQGWPDDERNLQYYLSALQEQIDIVNAYQANTINSSISGDQDTLNYLHRFFEDLRGEVTTGTDFYNRSPDTIKNAIDKFNVLIHETEHLIRNGDTPTIVGTFKDRPRVALTEDDFKNFTFKWKYGEVYINYCEVGKPLLDVFKDQDAHIGIKNIRPQEFYSADFMIKFGINVTEEHYQTRLAKFHSWYSLQPFKFKNLSLGMIPVAIIEKGEPYAGYKRIRSVCIR